MKQKSSISWLWKTTKPQMWLIILYSLSSMLTSASYVVPALLSKEIINVAVSAATSGTSPGDIIKYTLYLMGFVVLTIAVLIFNSHLCAVISGRLELQLRHNFFESITKKKCAKISSLHSGEILNRFTSDIDIVVSGITNFIPETLSLFSKAVAGFVVIITFSKGYAATIVGVGILIIICALLFKRIFKKTHKQIQESSGVMRGFAQECIENIVVVKTFANRIPLLNKLDNYMKKIYKLKIFKNHIGNVAGGGATFLYKIGYYATLCWGAFMIANKTMDYGTLMAFMQIVSQIVTPFFGASNLITHFYSTLASAERLCELEAIEDEEIDECIDFDSIYENIEYICAENINFKYDIDDIIEDSSFSIKKGSCVAITGPSGAGKSTLFKLMLGLYDQNSGKLYAQTKDGKIPLSPSTRPLFAYVPQGNLLISGTIEENIKFANYNASDEDMINAARTACIYDFIKELPNGFDSEIGEHGAGLSEGQVQRIAVARALCCGAPILLLDECTSALDPKTEEEMLKNIEALGTKTIFFISHKNAALSICDTHLKMEDKKYSLI